MLKENVFLDVKITQSSVMEHYRKLGYDCTVGDCITINQKDLSSGSRIKVKVICDYCGIEYEQENKSRAYNKRKQILQKDACCYKCRNEYTKEVNMIKYGVENVFQWDKFKEKAKQTSLDKYGVGHPMQNKEIRDKVDKTNFEKYGARTYAETDEFKLRQSELWDSKSEEEKKKMYNKRRETIFKKYGVTNIYLIPGVKEKREETNIKKYGVKNPSILSSFKKKQTYSKSQNKSITVSRAQAHIHNVIGGELNYHVGYNFLDIAFVDEMIYVEYDGSGHDLKVKLGNVTKEEFRKREIQRYYILKNKGWKSIRIISKNDKLPSDELLLHIINESKNKLNICNWVEINIDESKIKTSNEEIDYDFGKLKRIRKEVA